MRETVLVLDFGSQYTQLIARRIRERKVYCEIHPWSLPIDRIREMRPRAIVLSGGPASCYTPDAPTVEAALFDLGVPTLGICYGVQLAVKLLGGRVEPSDRREYGRADLTIGANPGPLFEGFEPGAAVPVWMSHGDRVEALPPGFRATATSAAAPFAAVESADRRFFGVQFHPEVSHTARGEEMLDHFVRRIAGCAPTWTMASFVEEATRAIRAQATGRRVLCGLSGGVDSAVAATLVHRAVGDALTCIFVDNGLLRAGEAAEVERVFGRALGPRLRVVDACDRFLDALEGVTDPEDKRKIIGRAFIEVFEEEARAAGGAELLVQGTLYPDVIESVSSRGGPSATIKSHHNVGGLPARMKLGLCEPLRWLFKDEVRHLGEELGLPRHVLWRQPFPGPGLAVRIVGEVTRERLAILRAADAIIEQEVRAAGLYETLWQSFGVFLPVRSVGVMGDDRTYENALAIRAVESRDGMTADWAPLPYELLARISSRVVSEVRGLNRVVYDVSQKPPATIEWE